MRVVPLERPIGFFFINIFDLEYMIRLQSCEGLHAKMNHPRTCLDHGLHVLKPWSFPTNYAPKMREYSIVKPKQNRAALWRIFSSNKSVPAKRKKGFYANRDPNKQEVGIIFAWSGSELWSLFKYSRVKLKNQKPSAANVLFKAYPMVPLSCRSNLALQYL